MGTRWLGGLKVRGAGLGSALLLRAVPVAVSAATAVLSAGLGSFAIGVRLGQTVDILEGALSMLLAVLGSQTVVPV